MINDNDLSQGGAYAQSDRDYCLFGHLACCRHFHRQDLRCGLVFTSSSVIDLLYDWHLCYHTNEGVSMNSRAFSAQTNDGKTIISVSTRFYPIHLSAAGKPTAIQSDDLFCWDGQSKTLQLTRRQPASTNRVLFAVGSHSDDKLLLQDFADSDIDLLLEEIAISARLKVRLCSISNRRSFFMIYHP